MPASKACRVVRLTPARRHSSLWWESPEIKDLLRMIKHFQEATTAHANKILIRQSGIYLSQVVDETQNSNDQKGLDHCAPCALRLVEYRPKGQSRWSKALVWAGADDPRRALASALGIPEREVQVKRFDPSPRPSAGPHTASSKEYAA